ncbi:MAG: FAD-binding oxidoreductase [Pseudomonadota bacterium]
MSDSKSFLQAVQAALGDSGVLTGDDVRARKASWLKDDPCQALAILRPATTEEVAAAVRLCATHARSLIPVGGNTGLVEGTLAGPDDVLLSLERMNRIESVDVAGGTLTVQSGVPLQRVQDAATDAGLAFPLDLGARGSATVGGTISTNAGGNAVIRYGMMREQVLGLEAVLADGTVVSSMNRMLKNNAGYDLKQLFIGTEGTLGIVTRAVLRLRAEMPSRNTALLGVDDYEQIPPLLRQLDAGLGGTLSAFEVLWRDFYDTVVTESDRHTSPLDGQHPYYVLVEARGSDQANDETRFEDLLGRCLEQVLITDAAIAQGSTQRDALWAIRDDIDNLVDDLSPAMAFDVSLPIADADRYTQRVHQRLNAEFGEHYRGTTFGHLGDSNIHFMLTIGTTDHERQSEAMRIVYEELAPYGGSVSAEHGIGVEKRPYLGVSRSDAELDLMRRLKKALDPSDLLNPGKVI